MNRWLWTDTYPAGYITYELAETLGRLTASQRAAISRIVEEHHIEGKPLAALFRGDNKICAENIYYRRGVVDPETGKRTRVGWAHQPAFVDALRMATRLAFRF